MHLARSNLQDYFYRSNSFEKKVTMKSAKKILLVFLCCQSLNSLAQDLTNEGTEFWCAYTEVYDHTAALFEINISSRVPASGVVEIPGTGFSAPFTVVPGTVTNVTIPPVDANITANETVLNRAIHITSDNLISAFASTFHLYRSEATILLPVSSLGSNYMASSQANFSTYKSHFTVVAGSSPCTVDITVSCPTESGHIAGDTWPVTLNPGEIYMVQAANGPYDISGSTIKATNSIDKFAVFNGHTFANGTICLGVNKDPLYEIAFPIESFGTDHIIVKTAGQNRNSYRVIAVQNGTDVFENGTLVATLNAGQFYDALFVVECLIITASNPVGVTQHMVGSSCSLNNAADPAMVAINPNEQMYLDSTTFFAVAYNGIDFNFVNIITRTSETSFVEFNSAPVTTWIATPDPLFSYAIIATGVGSHTITTTGCGFLAYAYGHQWAESYFYSAGCRVNIVEDSIDFDQYIGTNPNFCDIDTVQFTPYTSGGPVISYQWSFGDGATSSAANPLHVYNTSGIFVVELIVEYQCLMDTIVDTIQIFDSPAVTGLAIDAMCSGLDGGTDITVSSGTPAYSYLWNTGATTEDLTGLSSGIYDVVVTDAMGCVGYDTLTVTVISGTIVATVTSTDPVCNGETTGSATVTSASGGTSPYTYLWSSGGSSSIETGLGDGTYSVTVTDANGCEVTETITLTEPALVTVTTLPDTIICVNGSTTLSAIGAGGSGALTYNWIEGGFPILPGTVNPTASTCYEVLATDANGCTSPVETFCVTLLAPLSVSLTAEDICQGEMANVDATVSGGDGAYTYSWTSSDGAIGSTEDISILQTSVSEAYCVLVSDGCETPDANACIIVNAYDLPDFSSAYQNGCAPYDATFDAITDPSIVASVNWNFRDGESSTAVAPSHNYEIAGSYDVTVTLVTVDGCVIDSTFESLVDVWENPYAAFTYSPNAQITVENTEVEFNNTSINGYSWSWNFGDASSFSAEENPTHTFPAEGNQTYTISLTVESEHGCIDVTQHTILIEEVLIFYVPNAFTPDGNDLNNEFKPVFTAGFDPYDYHLTIFNRWGEMMFESYNVAGGWDGTYANNGLAEDGVYIWQVEFGDTNSDKRTIERGHVSMLR